jgi:hypothetical protein
VQRGLVRTFRGFELERDGIGTVALICGGLESLTMKDVANVTSASSAADLRTSGSKGIINVKCESTFNSLVEGWPSTSRVKLGFALVEWRLTSSA